MMISMNESTVQQLKRYIKAKKFSGKSIYFMGGLPLAYDTSIILGEAGLKIEGVLDNNSQKWGDAAYKEFQYQIYSPEKLNELKKGSFILIIYSKKYWLEMKEQFENMGYVRNKHFLILDAYDLQERMKMNYIAGKLLYNMRKSYGKDATFILMNSVMGDCYLSMLCMKEYIVENNIVNPVLVGVGKCKKVINLYEGYKFVELKREEIVALELYATFVGEKEAHLKILSIWDFELHLNRCRIRFAEKFRFMNTYTDFVFNLQKKQFDVPRFKCDGLEELFRSKGLKPGKTVILSPYAYSIHQQPPTEFWQKLAEHFWEKGYSVCVNVNPEIEVNPVPKAETMTFSLKESVAVLEYAGVLVAMRSGFCDVTSSARCKKILFYPKRIQEIDYENHRPDKDFGGLCNMGLSDDAIELEFDYEPSTYQVKWKNLFEEVVSIL